MPAPAEEKCLIVLGVVELQDSLPHYRTLIQTGSKDDEDDYIEDDGRIAKFPFVYLTNSGCSILLGHILATYESCMVGHVQNKNFACEAFDELKPANEKIVRFSALLSVVVASLEVNKKTANASVS